MVLSFSFLFYTPLFRVVRLQYILRWTLRAALPLAVYHVKYINIPSMQFGSIFPRCRSAQEEATVGPCRVSERSGSHSRAS